MSVVLPAALALWMMMASGRSSLRDTPARYATERVGFLADDARLVERLAQTLR